MSLLDVVLLSVLEDAETEENSEGFNGKWGYRLWRAGPGAWLGEYLRIRHGVLGLIPSTQ